MKKVKMTCILKSGQVVKDTIKASKETISQLNFMKHSIESELGATKDTIGKLQNITFGYTTIALSEIAAITIK